MRFLKQHLGAVMAGAVILGGSAFVATQELAAEPSDGDTISLAQDAGEQPPAGEGSPRRPGHGPVGFGKAIRGEAVVPEREGDGYTTVRFDRGILNQVDGTTVVVDEADGTTVEVPTDEETRVSRDGETVELSALQPGDHVATFRVKEGGAFVTKGVRAITPERWEEMEGRHEQMQERREGMRERIADRRENRRA